MEPATETASDPLEAANQRFLDTVDRIVQRVNLAAGHEGTPPLSRTAAAENDMSAGPLALAELGDLSLLCSLANTLPASTDDRPMGFAAVEYDQLSVLTEFLGRHINAAANLNLMQQAQECMEQMSASASDAPGERIVHRCTQTATSLRMGLEAASVVVFMATSQGVDRRATNEDAIQSSILLMRSHLQKNLIPSFCSATRRSNNTADRMTAVDSSSPAAKRRKVSSDGSAPSTTTLSVPMMRLVHKLLNPTIGAQITLVERLEALVRRVPLDDQQIFLLTNPAMAVLEMDCLPSSPAISLQKAYIALITEAFSRYKLHRETILEDLFPVMLRLPSGKKMRACHLPYKGVPSGASLAAFNASLLHNLIPNAASQPHYIQMMTAMLLSLVQCCITRPRYEVSEQTASDDNDQTQPHDAAFSNGQQECRAIVNFFCIQLLGRCSKKQNAIEFRPILVNLVEDLLLCLLIPEYPAAELLLSRLLSLLTIDMKRSSANSGKSKQSFETTYLNTAFDVIGKIGSVQARILAVARDKALHTTIAQEPVPLQDDGDDLVMGCYCGNPSTEGRLAIECDHCRISYHGGCVNHDGEMLEAEWFCDACKLGRLYHRERRRHDDDGEMEFVNEEYALYQSFFSILSHRDGGTMKELRDATRMHLSRWTSFLNQPNAKSTANGIVKKPLRITRDLLEFWDRPGPGAEPLSDEGTNRLILSLNVKTSQLFTYFLPQISIILQLMSDGSHALRKLSLKAIEKIAEGDPSLMAMKHITEGVSRRFVDESISVREAAISLVGAYVLSAPHVADSFHSSLLPCLSDSGVSVRKRAVKILEGILKSSTSYKGRAQACNVLLQRAADPKEEDSVRDSIYDLFTNMWLRGSNEVVATVTKRRRESSEEIQSPSSAELSEQVNLVTPTPTTTSFGHEQIHMKRSDIAAEQMMKVVRSGGTSSHLEALLCALLEGSESQKGEQTNLCLNQKFRDDLVESLFELLLTVEEQRSKRSSRVAKDIAATLQTIATFARLAPDAVLRQIDVLLPFLKADNGVCFEDETTIVSAVCDILYRLCSSLGVKAASRLSSLKVAKDLRSVVCKFPPSTIENAVRAWSAVIQNEEKENSEFSIKFLGLLRSFYRHLVTTDSQFDDFSAAPKTVIDSVHRSLTIIGYVCQFHGQAFGAVDWDSEIKNATTDFKLPPANDLDWDGASISCYRIFSRYLMKKDHSTKCKALSSYCGLFLVAPRLLLKLEQVQLISALLDEGSALELRRETLRCFQKILVLEEMRIDGGTAKLKTEVHHSVSERISGDQDGDASIFGGILANHADRLCELTQSGDVQLRDASLKLLEVLLRQGLVNPNDAVPFLFALQGDVNNNSIRSRALRLLMTEAEKRPDMIRQRVCAGIKKAYALQSTIYPSEKEVSALVAKKNGKSSPSECIFDSVFIECIRSNRKQRLGLYTNLLGQFELYNESEGLEGRKAGSSGKHEAIRPDLALLSFSSQVLAHLPYNTVADPLFIIHQISSIVGFQGTHVLDQMAAVLRPVGLASDDELDETNASEDDLERAAKSKFPKNTKEAHAILSKDFPLGVFAELCRAGAGLTLLLRLKAYLRNLYNLSESRCIEFDPNAKERVSDKNVSKKQAMPAFDTQLFVSHKRNNEDVDSMIRQYAEFRTLMREETASALEAQQGSFDMEAEADDNDVAEE